MADIDPATAHTAEFWDERYADREPVWSGNPNVRLVEQTADLTPGAALDVGCGEGGDAVWLATQGWSVTATDVSPVAVAKAEAHAVATLPATVAARITWRAEDMRTWAPEQAFDLVSMHYVHPHRDLLPDLYARIAGALRTGGRFLLVNHDPHDLETSLHRPNMPDMLLPVVELVAAADPDVWDVEFARALPRPFHDPEGNPVTIHDAVLRLRRR